LAGLKFLKSKLGVGMDVPPQLDKSGLQGAGAVKHDLLLPCRKQSSDAMGPGFAGAHRVRQTMCAAAYTYFLRVASSTRTVVGNTVWAVSPSGRITRGVS